MATAAAASPNDLDLGTGVGATVSPSGSVERVRQAMGILKTIKASDIQIETNILYNPLYTATALQRGNQDVNLTGTDEIVRKNLYFMAEKITNIHALLIQLVQRGFLNLSERETILKQEDEFLKAVGMLIVIVQKDSSRYKRLLDIFHETGNEEIADILTNAASAENIRPTTLTPTTPKNVNAQPKREPETPMLETPWNCPHCTFRNTTGIICEMCARTNDLLAPVSPTTTTPKGDRFACNVCTFLNEQGSQNCAICANDLLNP